MNDCSNLRNLLDGFYDVQKLRIATGNRIVASFNRQLGQEPGQKLNDIEDKEAQKTIKVLKDEYDKITDGYIENKVSVKKYIAQVSPEMKFIKDATDYKLIEQYMNLMTVEKNFSTLVEKEVKSHPLWDAFFADVVGCGPMMAAVCLAYFDPYKARHASSFWKYAGLDVVVVEKDGEFVGQGRCRAHTEMVPYTDKNGEEKMKKGITFNPVLKTKLLGVLGTGFIKKPGCKYEQIYRGYRFRLDNTDKYNGYTAGHKHNMALRYAVKMFVRDLWEAWRTLEGLEVTKPYEVAYLGKNPHGYNDADRKMAEAAEA